MMQKLLTLALLGTLLFSSAHASWQLDWNDEFSGDTLDTKKWDIEVNCWGGGNAENQCYTARPENVWVSGGSLHLKPIAEEYRGSDTGCTLDKEGSCTWSQPATSGRVRSLKAVDGSWKYGRFEIRAKLPKGDFLWPAIWMLPTDNKYGTWAASGEIDILEARGQTPNGFSSALHFGSQRPNNKHIGTGTKFYDFDLTEDFHTYTLEWEASQLKIYVDSILHWTRSLDRSFGDIYPRDRAPFDERFHLIMNVAVGGGYFNEAIYGSVDVPRDSPTWTQEMQVDFVRVYKWVDMPAPTPVRPNAPASTSTPGRPTPVPTPTPTPVRPPVTVPTHVLPPVTIIMTPTASSDTESGLPTSSEVISPSGPPTEEVYPIPITSSPMGDSPVSSPVDSLDDITQDTATELTTAPSVAASNIPLHWLLSLSLTICTIMTMI